MDKVKQVIVVRTDLNMRKGKIASQVAHASLKVFLDKKDTSSLMTEEPYLRVFLSADEVEWITGSFTKIVLGVDSEEDLLKIFDAAKNLGIATSLVTDNGDTEFHGVPTHTAVSLGPAKSSTIDRVTSRLRLL